MRSKHVLVALVLLCGVPVTGLADGKFFPPTALGKVEIPDQQALICYTNGVETLVIDTAFRGDGGEFAWVVPLPARPQIAPATTGLFPTLQARFAPKVILGVQRFYVWATFANLLMLLVAIVGVRTGASPLRVLAALFLLAFMSGLLLPALAKKSAVAGGGPDQTVRLLDRQVVGVFDTVTLASPDGRAVLDWLNQNGFAVPTDVGPVIANYAAEGWVFVASRLKTSATTNEIRRAHPLAFTFRTPKPVYPLRLTGVGNPPLKVDLYVFGPDRARARGFTVKACQRPDFTLPGDFWRYAPVRQLALPHPELRRFAAGAAVVTKLSATLSPRQMASDAWIEWEPFVPTWPTFYSSEAAWQVALNFGSGLFLGGLAMWSLVACFVGQQRRARLLWRWCAVAATACVLVMVATLVGSPTTKDYVSIGPRHSGLDSKSMEFENITWLATSKVKGALVGTADPEATLRRAVADWFAGPQAIKPWTNPFTGTLPREEDSPGNYVVRRTGAKLELVWFDLFGGEHVQEMDVPPRAPAGTGR